MDTFKIKALMTAIKYKNFTKAAEEYSYTPSAFSHMAHSLNDELGITLFKRTSTGVELTKEGEILYNKMAKLVSAEEDLLNTAAELAKKKKLELRIGTYSSISKTILPDILKRFKEENPDVLVSLIVSVSLRGWLAKNKADIVFGDNGTLRGDEWFPLMDDPFVAVVPENLYAGKDSITLAELYENSYISTKDVMYKSHIDESKFKEIIPFAGQDDAAVISLIREGIGVSILPLLSCKEEKGVRVIPLTPTVKRTLGFAYKKSTSSAVEKFINFIKETQR